MQVADELGAHCPYVIDMPLDRFRRQVRRSQMFQEWTEQRQELLAGRQVFIQVHPRGDSGEAER